MKNLTYILYCVFIIFFIISCDENQPSKNTTVYDNLPPPKNVKVVVDDEWWIYNIRWDPVLGAAAYIVNWKHEDEEHYHTISRESLKHDVKLDRSKTYSFAVQAERRGAIDVPDISNLSEIVTVKGDPTIPSPKILNASGLNGPTTHEIASLYGDENEPWGKLLEFTSVVHAEKKALWEALGIRSYRFTATGYSYLEAIAGTTSLYYTVTVYYDKKPEIICNKENIFDSRDPFINVNGKTIDAFFSDIQEQFADSCKYNIRYNADYYYPEFFIKFYPAKQDTDGTYPTYFYIHSFEVLEE